MGRVCYYYKNKAGGCYRRCYKGGKKASGTAARKKICYKRKDGKRVCRKRGRVLTCRTTPKNARCGKPAWNKGMKKGIYGFFNPGTYTMPAAQVIKSEAVQGYGIGL